MAKGIPRGISFQPQPQKNKDINMRIFYPEWW